MHPYARRAVAALAAAGTAAGLAVTLSAAPAGAATTPTAAFTKTSDWGTGFEGRYTITNGGSATISGWTVQFDLPANVSISSAWDGRLTRAGNHYTVTDAGWNAVVAPGGTASFGFTGPYSGTFGGPSNCALNGAGCTGGAAPPTNPPTTPPPTTPPPPPPGPAGPLASAPYLMPLENDPPDINTVMAATGVKTFTLAFILSDGACHPVWSGGGPVSTDTVMAGKIAQIRAAGGDVMPSVGGFNGTKLGENCGDATSLAAAYQTVIDRYSLKAIDFDIESTEFENTAAQDRVTTAIRMLKTRTPALKVYVTMPVGQTGLTFFGNQLVQSAIRNGAAVDGWTIMPFDLGGGTTGMGQLTITVAEDLHAQLRALYPALSDDAVYRMSGISSMNGRTDVGEIVRQADMRQILAYAQLHHLARFTYWSVNRDRQCATPEAGTTSGTCSSVTQAPWEFTSIVAQYRG
ncbi:MAG TPA: cellulose binding domain-containing protein [Mycobacteriales bacterium]|nr:cellulose binding domain-containing protein [Mycobacteriales bacterium]